MAAYSLRPALETDFPAIRRLIWRVKINPTGLDWRRFSVAVDASGNLLACGQIKPHPDGSRELASIAVQPERQGQGIGGAIVKHLIEQEDGLLYLTTRARLGPYYQKFGFSALADPDDMPPYFRKIARLSRFLGRTGLMPADLLVMKRP